MSAPNLLFISTDQQRFDSLALTSAGCWRASARGSS